MDIQKSSMLEQKEKGKGNQADQRLHRPELEACVPLLNGHSHNQSFFLKWLL